MPCRSLSRQLKKGGLFGSWYTFSSFVSVETMTNLGSVNRREQNGASAVVFRPKKATGATARWYTGFAGGFASSVFNKGETDDPRLFPPQWTHASS